MITLYVHIEGLDTALVEVDELPKLTDTIVICKNPRRRDGKDLPYLLVDVTTMIIPMNRVTFIEVVSAEEEEEFETFIRD